MEELKGTGVKSKLPLRLNSPFIHFESIIGITNAVYLD
jgi:hypothetical protein